MYIRNVAYPTFGKPNIQLTTVNIVYDSVVKSAGVPVFPGLSVFVCLNTCMAVALS